MFIVMLIVVAIVVMYTIGYAFTLWKEKNYLGAFVVYLLIAAVIVTPFFSNLE